MNSMKKAVSTARHTRTAVIGGKLKNTVTAGALLLLTFALVFTVSCKQDPLKNYDVEIETDLVPIKDVYKDHFPVGAAVEANQLKKAEGALLRYHFSSLTAEN
ncbi:MAG: hypothetical protein ACOC2H_09605, partial [Spirochaetota bacterium]